MTKREAIERLARCAYVLDILPDGADVLNIETYSENKLSKIHLMDSGELPDFTGEKQYTEDGRCIKRFAIINGVEVFTLDLKEEKV